MHFFCFFPFTKKPDSRKGAEALPSMEEEEACEIARLPEELLSAAISRTAPRDACRVAAVSPAFRAAADSDAVWASFLPRDLPDLADGELAPAPPSKKELFLRLSTGPLLLPDMFMARHVVGQGDRGKVLCALGQSAGHYLGGTPKYWRWIPLTDSRSISYERMLVLWPIPLIFTEAAELMNVCWLEIHGKIDSMMLSPNSTYAAVLVFKIAHVFYELDTVEGIVNLGGTKSSREVALTRFRRPVPPEEESAAFPQTRADGWMEVELGEFFNEEGEDGNVSIRIWGKGPNWKKGLIVQGIEIRIKKSGR